MHTMNGRKRERRQVDATPATTYAAIRSRLRRRFFFGGFIPRVAYWREMGEMPFRQSLTRNSLRSQKLRTQASSLSLTLPAGLWKTIEAMYLCEKPNFASALT